jgi:hypothetical protein
MKADEQPAETLGSDLPRESHRADGDLPSVVALGLRNIAGLVERIDLRSELVELGCRRIGILDRRDLTEP